MNFKYLTVAIAVLSLLAGCAKEKDITPQGIESVTGKFEFPQGNSNADRIFEQIDEQFGVKFIYKNFLESDWMRTWVAPEGGMSSGYLWKYVDQAGAELAASRMEIIFSYLPVELGSNVLRATSYFYVADDMKKETYNPITGELHSTNYFPTISLASLDSKTMSIFSDRGSDDYTGRIFGPAYVLCNILETALTKGLITLPAGFRDIVDYTTSVTSYNTATQPNSTRYNDFWARRGFCPFTSTTTGRITATKSTIANLQNFRTEVGEFRLFFLYLVLEPNLDSRFEAGGLFEDCPLLRTRLDAFRNHMKNAYGIDLRQLHDDLFEGFTGDLDPDRIYSSAAGVDFSYIYG